MSGSIHANNMGDYVGAIVPKRRTYYKECPRCGGRKMAPSELCSKCRREIEKEADEWGKENWPKILHRHALFEFALWAGYETEELIALIGKQEFPSRRVILGRAMSERVDGYRVGKPPGE